MGRFFALIGAGIGVVVTVTVTVTVTRVDDTRVTIAVTVAVTVAVAVTITITITITIAIAIANGSTVVAEHAFAWVIEVDKEQTPIRRQCERGNQEGAAHPGRKSLHARR